jgi:hypothetical protein
VEGIKTRCARRARRNDDAGTILAWRCGGPLVACWWPATPPKSLAVKWPGYASFIASLDCEQAHCHRLAIFLGKKRKRFIESERRKAQNFSEELGDEELVSWLAFGTVGKVLKKHRDIRKRPDASYRFVATHRSHVPRSVDVKRPLGSALAAQSAPTGQGNAVDHRAVAFFSSAATAQ